MIETKWLCPTIDDWQKQILECQTNFMLFCGRQVGKTEIVAKKAADYLLNNSNKKILIVSGVERQASSLYDKVLRYIENGFRSYFKVGKDRPLKTEMKLKNGSILITEPVGVDGASARRHTLNGIIIEEMQLVPEAAYSALTPMLLTTGGFIWMLGTAWATEGYVYDRLADKDFFVIRVNSEEVAEKRPEPQRTIMLKHLERERHRLSEAQYAQEYLAIPQENARQIFPDTLIAKILTEKRLDTINKNNEFICGVDPAGLGEDEGDICILSVNDDGTMRQVENIITEKLLTTETTKRIISLYNLYNFKKIYIDDGGVGFGVFSELLSSDETRYITEALNNSSRGLDIFDDKRKQILKEDLIFNLLTMMERGDIKLLDDPEIRESLKSYRFEYQKDDKKLLIRSNYNHPVEALIRSAWFYQTKGLNMRVYSIKI